MLDSRIIKDIEEFVYAKPRSIQEISEKIKKNWRTADRYIERIKKEFGTLEIRTFREGTRGALKIVYWASLEKRNQNVFQDKLEQEILTAKKKEDFSAFDIFQHIKDENKKAMIEKSISEDTINLQELSKLLKETKKELISFSGNLSYINLKKGNIDLFKEIENLVKKDIKIRVLCRVDIAGKENIEKLMSLNSKYGKDNVEIRHHEHPIRAFIFDRKIIRIKEITEPTGKINELDKKIFIFYTIKDKSWAEWLAKIFFRINNNSIGAEKRISEIDKIFQK
ncbi:MAG: hypothetical protein AABW50_05235 [Nanoarchaeota archaeon]